MTARRILAASCALFVALLTQPAAAECDPRGTVGSCVSSDAFWARPGPMRFAGIASAELPSQDRFGVSLWQSVQYAPIIYRLASPGPGGTRVNSVGEQWNATVIGSYGLLPRLAVHVALPFTLHQRGAGTEPLGGDTLAPRTIRDPRLGAALALVRPRSVPAAERDFRLTAVLETQLPSRLGGAFAGERGFVFAPGVTTSVRVWRLFLAGEVGMRIRPVVRDFLGRVQGTELPAALGASLDLLPRRDLLALGAEVRANFGLLSGVDVTQGATGVGTRGNAPHNITSEWTAFVRTAPFLGGDASLYAGGGGPLPLGSGSLGQPAFRFLLGLSYVPLGKDRDGDARPDRWDRCPDEPGDRSDGCPRAATRTLRLDRSEGVRGIP